MDVGVALVQTYLRLNGYFTVSEFPIIAEHRDQYRAVTDVDILAFRFAAPQNLVARKGTDARRWADILPFDVALGGSPDSPDMIIGEVKTGCASLNRAATDASVLRVALARFGCCGIDDSGRIAEELIRRGRARTAMRHDVRLVAFGSSAPAVPVGGVHVVLLADVVRFIDSYIRMHWPVLKSAESKDPAFALVATLWKAGVPPFDAVARSASSAGASS